MARKKKKRQATRACMRPGEDPTAALLTVTMQDGDAGAARGSHDPSQVGKIASLELCKEPPPSTEGL
eukprot:12908290-Prorocentrum_lima.AAC.1